MSMVANSAAISAFWVRCCWWEYGYWWRWCTEAERLPFNLPRILDPRRLLTHTGEYIWYHTALIKRLFWQSAVDCWLFWKRRFDSHHMVNANNRTPGKLKINANRQKRAMMILARILAMRYTPNTSTKLLSLSLRNKKTDTTPQVTRWLATEEGIRLRRMPVRNWQWKQFGTCMHKAYRHIYSINNLIPPLERQITRPSIGLSTSREQRRDAPIN